MDKVAILNAIKEHLRINSNAELARFLGVKQNVITNWYSRNTFNAELINTKCVGIDANWLLTGEGDMLLSPKDKTYTAHKSQPTYVDESASLYANGIPLIPLNALAGIGISQEYQIKDSDIEERYIIPDFDKVKPDYLIRVKGSSMYPKYNSGDIIAIKRVDHSLYIQWNKPYVIDTISNGVLVKRIKQSEQKDHIKLISDNKDYDPFDIPTSDVRSVCIVVGVIRLE